MRDWIEIGVGFAIFFVLGMGAAIAIASLDAPPPTPSHYTPEV